MVRVNGQLAPYARSGKLLEQNATRVIASRRIPTRLLLGFHQASRTSKSAKNGEMGPGAAINLSWHSQQGAVVLLLWPVLCCVMLMLLGFDTSYKTRGCERANQQPTARCKSCQASTACMPRPLAPSTRCCPQGLDLSRPASYTGVLLPSGTPLPRHPERSTAVEE